MSFSQSKRFDAHDSEGYSELLGEPCAKKISLSGISYRRTDIELRECFALNGERNAEALERVMNIPGVDEAVVVSTCNRVEVVTATNEFNRQEPEFERAFADISGVDRDQFRQNLYHLHEKEAVKHVFSVASGLDSMVLGETQVLGQLKTAYKFAQDKGTTRALLNRLFHRAFRVAKSVRSKTKIGENAVSVCYVARELAEKIFSDMHSASVMLIGTGDMGRLALRHFASAGVKRFYVVSEHLDRAVSAAEEVKGIPLTREQSISFLPEVDIVIGASTVSRENDYLITKEILEGSLRNSTGSEKFFIDLGVPRNFSPDLDGLNDVFLYNLDDLQVVVKDNLEQRAHELDRATIIVDEEVDKFQHWLALKEIEPSIRKALSNFRELKNSELEKTIRRLRRENSLSENQLMEVRAALSDFSEALTAKMFHKPITELKREGVVNAQLRHFFSRFFLSDK